MATFIAHFIFILIIFVLPELMWTIASPRRAPFVFFPNFYIKTLIFIAVFYVNYLVIVDRTITAGRRRILLFVFWNIILVAFGLFIDYLASSVWFPFPHRHPHDGHSLRNLLKWTSYLFRDGAMMILSIGLAVALRLSMKWKDMEQQRKELIAAQRSTELDNLKSQLNPHFLFNTLNTIYALIDIEPDDAKAAVHRLSGLLRYMLYESATMVKVSEEIGFIEDYVELMRLRLSGHPLCVDIDVSGHESDLVPPLILVALIENAFKYGSTADKGEAIKIDIYVKDGRFCCRTENSFVGEPVSPVGVSASARASGIGLTNLRRRLSLIYGHRASLKTVAEGHVFKTILSLPL